jgi:hypothetical protein
MVEAALSNRVRVIKVIMVLAGLVALLVGRA